MHIAHRTVDSYFNSSLQVRPTIWPGFLIPTVGLGTHCSAHCTLHTAHCTLHTAHCAVYSAQCTVKAKHCTVQTKHTQCCILNRLNTVHRTHFTEHSTILENWMMCSKLSILVWVYTGAMVCCDHTEMCTVGSELCQIYCAQCSVFSVVCTVVQ